jgi:bacterial/archaeal transporter family-2 protein
MQIGLIAFIVVAGVLNGLQTGMNSQLTKSLGNPVLAGPIVYGLGFICFVIAVGVMSLFGLKVGDYGKLAQTPWWAIIGGMAGAVFTLATLAATPKVGAGVFVAVTVTTGVVVSIIIDHFGIIGVDKHPANIGRIIGAALMIGGVLLVGKF